MFGRVKPDSIAHAARLAAHKPLSLVQGPMVYPDKSELIYRFRHPRQHDQRNLGCCVGEGGADAAEIDNRIVRPIGLPYKPVTASKTFSSLWCYYIARLWAAQHNRPVAGEGAVVSDLLDAVKTWGVIPYDAWPSTPENVDHYSDARPVVRYDDPNVQRWFPREAGMLTSLDEILYTVGVRQIPVLVGSEWCGGFKTGVNNGFGWGTVSAGGHCYTITGYDRTANPRRVWVDCAWDPQWGTQPVAGSQDQFGNVLPHAYAWTNLDVWGREFSAAAFQSGDVEAIYFAGFYSKNAPTPPPVPPTPPQPPAPTPTPPATAGSGVVTIGGKNYSVTLTEIAPK